MARLTLSPRSGASLSRAVVILAFSCAIAARADDWPQWQGPERNAMSKEKGLLQEWPKDGPPLAWKINKLGGGYSEPSISAGRIYGMSNRGEEQVVWCLSEMDGKEIWAVPIGPAYRGQRMPQGEEGPGCTPTVDGQRLYVEGNGGEVACMESKDGKIVWQKSLVRDFRGSPPTWAYRESPLVDGEKVIVTPGGPSAMLVALNKATGETIWKCQLPAAPASADGPGGPRGGRGGRGGFGGGGAAYASPIAIDFEGQRQYVQLTARALIGVAAADGKFLWRYDRVANGAGINCTTPLYHNGTVFAASAYGAGGGLVKLSKDGGAVKAEQVWFSQRMQNHHGGVILVGDALYGANGGNEGGALVCLDFKTGDVLWNQRDERRAPKGAIAFADGRLYYRTETGTVLLIEPDPKQYVEKGRFEHPDRSAAPDWSHPVIANGKLYLRDQDVLLCYDVKGR
ncbi:MAG TPA: PQQ-binding-like beta-propeller repeat protein [Tepidisphaeraceae bacterium]|nr:PQQ-binding-like beta-propeller repeat protein [Tepidisphaeraceae bacterium]